MDPASNKKNSAALLTYISEPPLFFADSCRLFDINKTLTIFDVGACEGEECLKYKNFYSNSIIYAFEPDPDNFAALQRNVSNLRDVNSHQLALSDTAGKAEFYRSSSSCDTQETEWKVGNRSGSLLPPHELTQYYDWLQLRSDGHVTTQTLQNFCTFHAIDEIDLLHMDVQGGELQVLRGAGNLLSGVKTIWLEVSNVPLYRDQPLKQDMYKFLTNNNFMKIMDTVSKLSGEQLWCNRGYFSVAFLTLLALKNRLRSVVRHLQGRLGL